MSVGSGSRDGATLQTELAVTRTVLASERTLMAWVRTALSMISFGFTIDKFLKGLFDAGAISLHRPDSPRVIGLFLVLLGTGSLLAGLIEHLQRLHTMPPPRRYLSVAFWVACAVLALGLLVLVNLIGHVGPF